MNDHIVDEHKSSLNTSDEYGFFKNYYIIIKNNKLDFFIWVIVSFFVALIGIWLPCIIHILLKLSENYEYKDLKLYSHLLEASPFILYSITFLGETVLSTISVKKITSSNIEINGKKIVWGIIVAIYIVIMSGILVITNILQVEINPCLQHILLFIAILIGLRLYPLRENLYEPTVTSVQDNNNDQIEKLMNGYKKKEDLLND